MTAGASIPVYPKCEHLDGIANLYAPFEQYVSGVLPLMLEHVWLLKTRNHSSALEEMDRCSWLSRLITLDQRALQPERQAEIAGWPQLRQHLCTSIDRCEDEKELPAMVSQCAELMMPLVQKRFIADYNFPQRSFGCWWYTLHDEQTHLALHLVNAYQPQSPFHHIGHFLHTMLKAVEHAVNRFPSIEVVSCGSWLNNLPKFQQLWPGSFTQGQKILNETGGFGPGAWGQYMSMGGGFNETKADFLRRKGRHPYPLTEARCTITEVLAHLYQRCGNSDNMS